MDEEIAQLIEEMIYYSSDDKDTETVITDLKEFGKKLKEIMEY